MNIRNPRRILALGAPGSGVLGLLKDLTGSAPLESDDSVAGLSHTWTIDTNYYKAEVPIWIDQINHLESWKADFIKPEAKEVVSVVGAWVYCFRKALNAFEMEDVKAALRSISQIIEKGCGSDWDGVCLAVAMHQGITPQLQFDLDEWEATCRELGFEYIDAEAKGRNEFGEPVGVARVREALETNDWSGDDTADSFGIDESDENGQDDFFHTFAAEEAEMEAELLGFKSAVNGLDDAQQYPLDDADEARRVEELESIMMRMKTIKDLGAEMPEADRKKFAAKAVGDLLKTL